MQEMQVQSLSQEDLLEEEMATHSSILAWRIPRTVESGGATVHGVAESDMTEHTHTHIRYMMCKLFFPIIRSDQSHSRVRLFATP